MGRALWVLFILLMVSFVGAAESTTIGGNPLLNQGPAQISAADVQTSIESLKKDIVDGIIANDDANMQALDDRVKGYMQQQQMKIVIAAIGVNMLVAGLVYFYLIKKNRDLSYESISLKRKKEIDDRNFMADNINQMRDRYEQLEEYLKTQIQPSLYSLEQLAQQRRFADDGSVRTGGQAFQQAEPGYGGGGQGYTSDVPMANTGYVQEPVQIQGQYPYGDQYEQPSQGRGQYGGAYQ